MYIPIDLHFLQWCNIFSLPNFHIKASILNFKKTGITDRYCKYYLGKNCTGFVNNVVVTSSVIFHSWIHFKQICSLIWHKTVVILWTPWHFSSKIFPIIRWFIFFTDISAKKKGFFNAYTLRAVSIVAGIMTAGTITAI